jgi:predicted MFS family arabinose efflux permease
LHDVHSTGLACCLNLVLCKREPMSSSWRCLAALVLARTAMGFQFQSIAAVAPLIGNELGLDKTQLGWLIGLYLLPGVAFALPGGLLGRRFGDKRLVLVGLALMGIGGAWLAIAGSFAAANAARFTSGIGAVILNVLMTKMVTDLFSGRERLLAMSVLINAWPIGIGISLALIGLLGEFAGWRWAVASTALFAMMGLVIVATIYRPAAAGGVASAPSAAAGIGLGVLSPVEWSLLAIGSLPWLLYNAAYQIVLSFLPSFLVGSGLGMAHAGWLVAVNTVMFVVSVQAGGFLLERSAHPERLCHAAIVAWCASLLFIAAGSEPLPWLVLGGLVGGIPAAALVSAPGEFLRPESRGAGMGVFYTVYYLGCAVLPTLAGALYDASGSKAALWMAAATALLATVTLFAFRRAMAARAA